MSHPQIMQVIKIMMKTIHQKSTARMTEWNSSKNSKILLMKKWNNCLTSQRENTHRKDKPEPCTEQGKHKEVLHQEVEMCPPINVSGDSDDERNSKISLETMEDRKSTRLNSSHSEISRMPSSA